MPFLTGKMEVLKSKQMNVNKQINTKEEATQYAIDWQNYISNQSLFLGELTEWHEVFENLAIKFDLQEEYRENGII